MGDVVSLDSRRKSKKPKPEGLSLTDAANDATYGEVNIGDTVRRSDAMDIKRLTDWQKEQEAAAAAQRLATEVAARKSQILAGEDALALLTKEVDQGLKTEGVLQHAYISKQVKKYLGQHAVFGASASSSIGTVEDTANSLVDAIVQRRNEMHPTGHLDFRYQVLGHPESKAIIDGIVDGHVGKSKVVDDLAEKLAAEKLAAEAKKPINAIKAGLTDKAHLDSFEIHRPKIEEAMKTHGLENLSEAQVKELHETFAKAHMGDDVAKAGEAARDAVENKIKGYGAEIKNAATREGLITKIVDKVAAGEQGKVTPQMRAKIAESLKANNVTELTEDKIVSAAKTVENVVKGDGTPEAMLENITKGMNKHFGVGLFATHFVTPTPKNVWGTFTEACEHNKPRAFGKVGLVGIGGYTIARGIGNFQKDEDGESHPAVAVLEIGGGAAAALAGLALKGRGVNA